MKKVSKAVVRSKWMNMVKSPESAAFRRISYDSDQCHLDLCE